jgi:peptidoglycan/xylan/chitin deacetylase (PgdA/CDA1 family)
MVMAKKILCAFSVDFDAVSVWLGTFGAENSHSDISRGMFGGEVGVPRLLKLFQRFGIKTSWFGHSIETFPEQTRMIVEAGHEIGLHGYTHEDPQAMTAEQEEIVLDRCIELIEKASGRRPTGYVAPNWEYSASTLRLLKEGYQVRPQPHAS